MVLLGVFEVENYSEWGYPSSAQPKPKLNWVRFLNNFINLNKKLKQKPHPMPKINEMLLKLEGFQYASSLDLNMGWLYYHIRLSENASNLCRIILLWVKYRYKRLTIGVDNSPELFQQKTNNLFHGFKFICAYIYDILILKNETVKIMYRS